MIYNDQPDIGLFIIIYSRKGCRFRSKMFISVSRLTEVSNSAKSEKEFCYLISVLYFLYPMMTISDPMRLYVLRINQADTHEKRGA